MICGLIREELLRDDCDPVIFALLQTQGQYGQIRKNIELGGFTCGSTASCPGPETREGLHFVAGAQVNYDEKPSNACWNGWLPDENSVLKPSLTLAAAEAPGCWPSVVKGGLSFDHRMGATDVILSVVETFGGFNAGNRPAVPVFQLFGDGHVVYRQIDPGVSTGRELEAQLSEDQVQELLRFALYEPGSLAKAEPLYERATFGPAGSTVFEINTYRFTARVEYQLPPGNLLADKDPAIKSLRILARRLSAFDPTPPAPKPTPIPFPTYLKSPGPLESPRPSSEIAGQRAASTKFPSSTTALAPAIPSPAASRKTSLSTPWHSRSWTCCEVRDSSQLRRSPAMARRLDHVGRTSPDAAGTDRRGADDRPAGEPVRDRHAPRRRR